MLCSASERNHEAALAAGGRQAAAAQSCSPCAVGGAVGGASEGAVEAVPGRCMCRSPGSCTRLGADAYSEGAESAKLARSCAARRVRRDFPRPTESDWLQAQSDRHPTSATNGPSTGQATRCLTAVAQLRPDAVQHCCSAGERERLSTRVTLSAMPTTADPRFFVRTGWRSAAVRTRPLRRSEPLMT